MKKNKFLLLVAVLIFSSLFFSQPVKTQEGEPEKVNITVPEVQINIPGLNFSSQEEVTQESLTGTTFLHVPFLAEYVAAVYKYAIAVASVLATIMIIFAGFQWLVSGGNAEAITRAKKRITNAVVGLLLALGSYALLANINPELVKFRSLKVQYIATEDLELVIDKGESPEGVNADLQGGEVYAGRRRTATTITEGGMKTALKVYNDVKALEPRINSTLSIPAECPLTTASKIMSDADSTALTTSAVKPYSYSDFDSLFQLYGNCLQVPWQVLKVLAFRESGLNSDVVNSIGFTGLFQTKKPNCIDYVSQYGQTKRCNNLKDPQLSTMVGASSLITSTKIIIEACGRGIDSEALVFYLYIGHHQGHGNLKKALNATKPSCKIAPSCIVFFETWNKQQKYNEKDLTAEVACNGEGGIIERLNIKDK